MNRHDDEDPDRRMTLNLLTIVVFLVLLVAGFWLMRELNTAKKAQDCLSSGGRRCAKIQTN
jgi:heme/copper-type cytochrome/quinol oxidase subunit 4